MQKFLTAALFAASAISTTSAQQVRPANSDKIYHEIAQMRHLVNVLYVAAHPDDENTRLLAWMVNDRNIRTAYLSLTRGDGGQNIIGSEQGEALGLIRTHELMEARKIDGAEQYFSRAIDFGFSKSYEETFKHWNKDTLVGDAVWVMRQFRPDVVICRFPPNTQAGHGQHAASAIIGAEAFTSAADASKYPEQLRFYPTWQPKRILWNTYKFGDRNTTSEDQFKLLVGDYEAPMGLGTGEIAGNSRSIHRSQGAGTPSVPGLQTEYFKLVAGEPAVKSLFDGIDITWGRVGRKDIGEDLKTILNAFNYRHPDASLPALMALRTKILTVKDEYWRKEKLGELDRIILYCTGFMAEFYTKQPQSVVGVNIPFTMQVIARSETPVTLQNIDWGTGTDSMLNLDVTGDSLRKFDHTVLLPYAAPVTEPYWLSQPAATAGSFTIPGYDMLGLPETPNKLNAKLTLKIGAEVLSVAVPLSYKKLDPVRGDVVEALRIVPPVTYSLTNNLLITNADGSVDASVKIHTHKDFTDGMLKIKDATGTVLEIPHLTLTANSDTVITFHLNAGIFSKSGKEGHYLYAVMHRAGLDVGSYQHLIQYNHIPTLQYFTTPFTKVVKKDWKNNVKHVGLIEGAGDYMATFLRLAGIEVDVLKESDFTDAAKLKKYDAIVTGIRAVNVEKRMSAWLPVLFKYAENGGTIVMQYNTLQDMATQKLGPYPFTLSDKRVTEEDAKMTFVDPKSRLLTYPNTITDADFEGWVQERGLYFATKWDDKYQPLFSMHDNGEEPLTGGTLYAKVGKGNYIYTSLSFSRQLPAGNKGAMRLLMNFLNVGK